MVIHALGDLGNEHNPLDSRGEGGRLNNAHKGAALLGPQGKHVCERGALLSIQGIRHPNHPKHQVAAWLR